MVFIETFEEFFKRGTSFEPYPYQTKFANDATFPDIINIPTGLGKTECVIIGWIWKRLNDRTGEFSSQIPARLVYSLPMRTLVEQIYDKTKEWVERLGLNDDFSVVKIMGGETADDWDIYPENSMIIIGTQDMLLSRALNRGYGMSRFRWPVQFGLLNNDSLWVFDEIQLMGSAIKTSSQLDAFRHIFGVSKNTKTIWMSATMKKEWLDTVDSIANSENVTLSLDEKKDFENEHINRLIKAKKRLTVKEFGPKKIDKMAEEIVHKHKSGTRTFIVLNTVKKAIDYSKAFDRIGVKVPTILIHSQFREEDRKRALESLYRYDDCIVVSTQVIEAGVDISCHTLFTEIAPIHSLIQRFGRCNRYGEFNDAEIIVMYEENMLKNALPYEEKDLSTSLEILKKLNSEFVTLGNLKETGRLNSLSLEHVIRRKDIIELFDTTKDVTGSDIDISVYVRDRNDFNVQVFWRDIDDNNGKAIANQDLPAREELCSAPVSDVKEILDEKAGLLWEQDWYDGGWTKIRQPGRIIPGKVIMMSSSVGCYSKYGWDIGSKDRVKPITHQIHMEDASNAADPTSEGEWKTIQQHTNEVVTKAKEILSKLYLTKPEEEYIIKGSRWHDAGKAHPAFQAKIRKESLEQAGITFPAKAPKEAWYATFENEGTLSDNYRRYFRHELASGLIAFYNGESNIVSYLSTAHHGKVRVSIRSLPDELIPAEQHRRFARGVWDDDIIPSFDLCEGIHVPSTKLNLDLMEVGGGSLGKSWVSRVMDLCDDPNIGIFRLSYYESIIRGADRRASGGLK